MENVRKKHKPYPKRRLHDAEVLDYDVSGVAYGQGDGPSEGGGRAARDTRVLRSKPRSAPVDVKVQERSTNLVPRVSLPPELTVGINGARTV